MHRKLCVFALVTLFTGACINAPVEAVEEERVTVTLTAGRSGAVYAACDDGRPAGGSCVAAPAGRVDVVDQYATPDGFLCVGEATHGPGRLTAIVRCEAP